jgi:hypothetical protein
MLDDAGMTFGDDPIIGHAWVGGELWLVAQSRVWPHTFAPDPAAPAATLIMGTRIAEQLPRNLGGGTLLLADIRLQTTPGPADSSFAVPILDGPAAWIVWEAKLSGASCCPSPWRLWCCCRP